tara:strand:- start:80 stop:493 length:414 start_codon:yes stop_codon:yes gene_type:complete
MQKGRVVDHRDQVLIHNAEFRVREGGRQRVIKERKKNVHAFVVGTLGNMANISNTKVQYLSSQAWKTAYHPESACPLKMSYTNLLDESAERIFYNPYLGPSFYSIACDRVKDVTHADLVELVTGVGPHPIIMAEGVR